MMPRTEIATNKRTKNGQRRTFGLRRGPDGVHPAGAAPLMSLLASPAASSRILPKMPRIIGEQKRVGTARRHRPVTPLGEGRWPLDLVREASGSGMLALRVREGAGLEKYGLMGRDIIVIGLEDPSEGEPTFAAINDQIVVGWYRSRPAGQVRILPFVDGAAPVTAKRGDAQVLFKLEAIVSERRLINHRQARRRKPGADG